MSSIDGLAIMDVHVVDDETMACQIKDLVSADQLNNQKVNLVYQKDGEKISANITDTLMLLHGVHPSTSGKLQNIDYSVADFLDHFGGEKLPNSSIAERIRVEFSPEGSQVPAAYVPMVGESSVDSAMTYGPEKINIDYSSSRP